MFYLNFIFDFNNIHHKQHLYSNFYTCDSFENFRKIKMTKFYTSNDCRSFKRTLKLKVLI